MLSIGLHLRMIGRPGRIGMTYVAAAGPIANLIVATAFAVVARAFDLLGIQGFAFVAAALPVVLLEL